MNEIRYFSMFTGVGGFEIGLESANNSSNARRTETERELSTERKNIIGQGCSSGIINKSESNAIYRCVGMSERANDNRGTSEECLKDDRMLNSPNECNGNGRRAYTCVGMSEWDKYSSQVLKYRFPNITNWGDCTKINPSELPDFDMLCGGFPCQAFSIAGKRRGFEDTRGTMFFEVARILKVKRPKIVLLENVKGLLNHNKGETFSIILEALDELGYEVQWMVLNSKFFGVPQNRERVLIIGSIRGEPRPEILPFTTECRHINETGEGQLSSTITSSYWKGWGGGRTAIQEIKAVLTPDRPEKRQNGRRFKEDGEPSFTLTGQDIHGVTDGYSIRRLTPTECCRLQGFPDDWNEWGINEQGEKVKMSDTQRYKQMGNAVTTKVIAAVATHLN